MRAKEILDDSIPILEKNYGEVLKKLVFESGAEFNFYNFYGLFFKNKIKKGKNQFKKK
jgi:hypothetical protein